MASIRKQTSGKWRVQVRRKGRAVGETFLRREDAKRWALDTERQIDRGETPSPSRMGDTPPAASLVGINPGRLETG